MYIYLIIILHIGANSYAIDIDPFVYDSLLLFVCGFTTTVQS